MEGVGGPCGKRLNYNRKQKKGKMYIFFKRGSDGQRVSSTKGRSDGFTNKKGVFIVTIFIALDYRNSNGLVLKKKLK